MDKVNYFSGGEEALVTDSPWTESPTKEKYLTSSNLNKQGMVILESEGILSASYVHI